MRQCGRLLHSQVTPSQPVRQCGRRLQKAEDERVKKAPYQDFILDAATYLRAGQPEQWPSVVLMLFKALPSPFCKLLTGAIAQSDTWDHSAQQPFPIGTNAP